MITEHPQPAASLTDASLRALVVDLAPLARLDAVAGLRARSRDPREQPGTGGEQRDAVAAWLGIDDGDARFRCAVQQETTKGYGVRIEVRAVAEETQ